MIRRVALPALVALLSQPALAADVEKVPGVFWEQSVEMQMAGFAMPAQTVKVCLPKGAMEQPPDANPDGDCQVTDLKRAGSRMTWKMKCKDGTSGTGDMTYGPSSFDGTMTMVSGGQSIRMAMKGKKVGGDCDANEPKRQAQEMQDFAAEQQAQQDAARAEGCGDAVREMDISSFYPMAPGAPVLCQKETADFCKRLGTREGLVAFRRNSGQEGARAQAEKTCKTKLADVEKRLCAEAAKEQARGRRLEGDAVEFVFGSCPDEAKALAKQECAGRSYSSMGDAQRDFCTRYAREELQEPDPQPASVPVPVPDVKRQIIRGIFGR